MDDVGFRCCNGWVRMLCIGRSVVLSCVMM